MSAATELLHPGDDDSRRCETDGTEWAESENSVDTKKEDKNTGTDSFLRELGGCGPFQIILIVMFVLAHIPDTFTFRLTSFAVYNPGFKCLDNTNITTVQNGSCSTKWERRDCSCFDSCENVEFNPETKTIVSEWGLACNRHYLLKTMFSLSPIGGIIANIVVGYTGDRFGRKHPLIISKLSVAILNVALALSPTWIVHAVLFCLLDFVDSFTDLLMLLALEYVPAEWRVRIFAVPASTVFATMFALTAMYTEDWKVLRYIAAATGFVFLIPLIWMPQSLRWLSVNGRDKQAYKVATRIAKMNKVEPPTKERLNEIVRKNGDGKIKTNTTIMDLFRKGYRLPTIALAFISFALSFDIKVIGLVISNLPGNLYTNIMIMQAGDLPANIICYVFANKFRRKPTVFALFCSVAVCFLGVVMIHFSVPEDQQRWPMIIVVMFARMFLVDAWIFLTTLRMEAYPTVARSTVISFCAFAGSIGNILSPLAIPKTPDTVWISYLSMAIITILCAFLIVVVPETKNKPLKDTWDETNITLLQSFSKKYQKIAIGKNHNTAV